MARGDGLLCNVWQAQVAAIIIIERVKLMQYASGGSFHYTKQVLHVKNVAYNRKCCIMYVSKSQIHFIIGVKKFDATKWCIP